MIPNKLLCNFIYDVDKFWVRTPSNIKGQFPKLTLCHTQDLLLSPQQQSSLSIPTAFDIASNSNYPECPVIGELTIKNNKKKADVIVEGFHTLFLNNPFHMPSKSSHKTMIVCRSVSGLPCRCYLGEECMTSLSSQLCK